MNIFAIFSFFYFFFSFQPKQTNKPDSTLIIEKRNLVNWQKQVSQELRHVSTIIEESREGPGRCCCLTCAWGPGKPQPGVEGGPRQPTGGPGRGQFLKFCLRHWPDSHSPPLHCRNGNLLPGPLVPVSASAEGSRDLGAELGKRCGHKVAVAHTGFTLGCFDRFAYLMGSSSEGQQGNSGEEHLRETVLA